MRSAAWAFRAARAGAARRRGVGACPARHAHGTRRGVGRHGERARGGGHRGRPRRRACAAPPGEQLPEGRRDAGGRRRRSAPPPWPVAEPREEGAHPRPEPRSGAAGRWRRGAHAGACRAAARAVLGAPGVVHGSDARGRPDEREHEGLPPPRQDPRRDRRGQRSGGAGQDCGGATPRSARLHGAERELAGGAAAARGAHGHRRRHARPAQRLLLDPQGPRHARARQRLPHQRRRRRPRRARGRDLPPPLRLHARVARQRVHQPRQPRVVRHEHPRLPRGRRLLRRGLRQVRRRRLRLFQSIFNLLPLATRINNEVLVVHGGLCRTGTATLAQLRAIDRVRPVPVSTAGARDLLFFDTMWADPQDVRGIGARPRAARCASCSARTSRTASARSTGCG